MNIAKATKKALKKQCMIRRRSWHELLASIKPTNNYECCCVAYSRTGKPPGKYWNPLANDLIADDWILTAE